MENFLDLITTSFISDENVSFACALLGLIFGLCDFAVYVIAQLWNNGVTKSISITYYSCKPRWLFQMFMWCAIFCILLLGQNLIYAVVGFLFGIMTCNPTINRGNVYFIPHMIGATSAIALANIGLGLCYGTFGWVMCGILAALLVGIIVGSSFISEEQCKWFNKEVKLWWIEVVSIIFMVSGLAIGNFLA